MRVDTAGPRTWLLATFAGWALLLWLLALLGMGGNIAQLDDDPALLQRLPTPRAPTPERIGPPTQYAEIAARPLFAENRRPQPFSLQPEGDAAQAQAFDFVLTSVLITPSLKMAIVQPAAGGESIRMKLGEAPAEAQGWRLVTLNSRSAVFEGPQGQKTLDLRVFDGQGGEAPTAVARPATATAVQRPDQPGVAVEQPAPATRPATPPPAPATTTSPKQPAVAGEAPMTPEAQMEAIRKRIEARRAQLRAEAQRDQAVPPKTK